VAGQKVVKPGVWKRWVRIKPRSSLGAGEPTVPIKDGQPPWGRAAERRSKAVRSRQAIYLVLDKSTQD